MGLYASTQRKLIRQLPDSVLSELPEKLTVVKRTENCYIIYGECKIKQFTYPDGEKGITLENHDSNDNFSLSYDDKVCFFQTGRLPLTNFQLVEVITDKPGGGLGVLVTYGLMRDVWRDYRIIAEFLGAEFDVTNCLKHYITSDLKARIGRCRDD